ncbi:MAG: ACT domain-containing protein [Lachnospiraceae bacterium]|nr:ACT domain-containing protein [Lachnospiraceae bacterium]
MSVKQISVFIENKPGTMHELTKVLAENHIDMRALSLAETEGFGIVRILVDDVMETSSVLKDAGYIYQLTPVVVVAVPDEPGGLNKVLTVFTAAGINLNYMYAIPGSTTAYIIFRVEDVKLAEKELRQAGIHIADQEEISAL